MSNNELHKSFTPRLTHITDLTTGEILDQEAKTQVLKDLAQDLKDITALAEWSLSTDPTLLSDLDYLQANHPALYFGKNAAIARVLGLTLPKEINPRGTGASRYKDLVGERTISEAKSWLERVKACKGVTTKRITQGWARTMDPTRPTDLTPMARLSTVNSQYAQILNDPVQDGSIHLKLLVKREWKLFSFNFDSKRFKDCSRVTLPTIRLTKDGKLEFMFTAVFDYHYSEISPDFIITVDVGVTNYATVGVYSVKEQRLVYSTTLSRRVHSLVNSVKASEQQKLALRKKGQFEEARLHREAASRKKRELAIIAGQEIAGLASEWGNSVVVFEDLSWVKNTMQNGRWNRGALVTWTTHFVELNGARVFKASAYRSSQDCYLCGKPVLFKDYHTVECLDCGVTLDRDVNACGNLGERFVGTLGKVVTSRRKAKKYSKKAVSRTPKTRESLKYPGRDRTKTGPTVKRPKKRKIVLGEVSGLVRKSSTGGNGPGAVLVVVSESKSCGKTPVGQLDYEFGESVTSDAFTNE